MPNPVTLPASPLIYCITDSRLSRLSHVDQMRCMIAGGARVVQLREKRLDDDSLRPIAVECLALCRAHGVVMVLNDRVALAAELQPDALHIGQEDVSPAEARAAVGAGVRIGVSTHNLEQFRNAVAEPVDYIALGPVFGTTTKENPDPAVGLDVVREAVALLGNDPRPLVLIGGITRANIAAVRSAAPKACIAIIGAVLQDDLVEKNVRELSMLLR